MSISLGKKIIIIISLVIVALLLIIGITLWQHYDQQRGLSENEILKSPKEKILAYGIIDAADTDSVVVYNYVSEVKVPQEVYKGLTEDITKRTSNSQTFLKGIQEADNGKKEEEYITKFYTAPAFEKNGRDWYQIETATTTPEAFVAQTKLTLLDHVKTLFGQKVLAVVVDINALAGDGYVVYSGTDTTTWETVRTATAGTSSDHTGAYAYTGGGESPFNSNRFLYRAFFPFDTSALPDDATINSAALVLNSAVNFLYPDEWGFVTVVQSTQSSVSSLGAADFGLCGAINSPVEGSSRVFGTDIGTNPVFSLPFNTTGISWINKTGYTKLGLREGHDISGVQPSGGFGVSDVGIYTSEQAGTGQDPYLEIIYNAAPAGTFVKDYDVSLVVNGQVVAGTNQAVGDNLPNGALDFVTYGGAGNTWGTNLTPQDVNNSNFGVAYRIRGDDWVPSGAEVDSVEVTVYYDVSNVVSQGQTAVACQADSDCPTGDSCFIEQRFGLGGFAWNSFLDGAGTLRGLGWIEFGSNGFTVPPWLQTKYGDIYAKEGLTGSGSPSYNATYRILSGGGIVNFRSARGQDVVSPYFGPINFPTPETRYSNILGKLDLDSLICVPTSGNTCVNEIGRTVVKINSQSDITQPMDGKIYYRDGDLTINNFVEFLNSTNFVNAAGTIIVNGDLTINANSSYDDSDALTRFRNLASVAWIVRGDLYIAPGVSELAGNFIVIGDGQNSCSQEEGVSVPGCGEIHSCYNSTACQNRLTVSGLMMARKFFLEREFPLGDQEATFKGSEIIIYDGRLLANTPPGMADFAQSLPIWRSETFSR
ncbi:MAG: hypothetical protein HUU49_02815 [Candidatus Buchananbacteria bacterium]|nr:hypothetical protein [Candidatus Buchananbacteria bacterium]